MPPLLAVHSLYVGLPAMKPPKISVLSAVTFLQVTFDSPASITCSASGLAVTFGFGLSVSMSTQADAEEGNRASPTIRDRQRRLELRIIGAPFVMTFASGTSMGGSPLPTEGR